MKRFNRNPLVLACCLSSAALSALTLSNVAYGNAVDDAADACKEAARLITEEDDIDGAIEEANWCLTGLTQLKEEIKLSLLPDELEGFVGGEIETESVLGMNSVTRVYTQDGDSLTVTLLTSGGDGGALAGFGELGKLLQSMEGAGGAASGKKVRIQRRTVIASDDGGEGSLSVELKSGGTLTVESLDLDSDELIDFLREFPLAELDDAIGG